MIGIATALGSEKLRVSGGTIAVPTATDVVAGAGILSAGAGLRCGLVGGGLSVKEGTNATLGTATLVAGTVTVATTKVTANGLTRAFAAGLTSITRNAGHAALGAVAVAAAPGGKKIAAHDRTYSEHGKKIRRNSIANHTFRRLHAGKICADVVSSSHFRKRVTLCLPIEEIGIGHRNIANTRIGFVEDYQLCSVAVGKRAKQGGIHETENRSGRANSQCKRYEDEHSNAG